MRRRGNVILQFEANWTIYLQTWERIRLQIVVGLTVLLCTYVENATQKECQNLLIDASNKKDVWTWSVSRSCSLSITHCAKVQVILIVKFNDLSLPFVCYWWIITHHRMYMDVSKASISFVSPWNYRLPTFLSFDIQKSALKCWLMSEYKEWDKLKENKTKWTTRLFLNK